MSTKLALCTLFSLVMGACLLGSIAAQTGSGMPTGVPGTTYRWETDPWGQCSRTCDGVQTRLVYCEGTQPDSSKIVVNDVICDAADPRFKPFDSRPCGVECPDPTFSWSTGPYGDCSSVCGPGTRSREVVCQKQEESTTSITTDNECLSNGLAPKPDTTESCVSPCEYTATNWTECSSSCNGNQTRTSLCTKTLSSGAQQTVDISYCDDDPFLGVWPPDSQPCNVGDYRWATSCSQTCDGMQILRVYCTCQFKDGTSAGVAESFCLENDVQLKPIEEQSCGIKCETTYSWSLGEWGVCSASCGQGVERRTVTCHRSTQLSSATVTDSECTSRGLGPKPAERRDCQEACQCVPSSWSSCSVRCGCGQQTRTFSCVQSTSGVDVVVKFRHCENDPTLDCPAQEWRQCKPCYEWDPQAWGACLTVCGPGIKERDVFCMRKGCDGVNRVDDIICMSQPIGPKPNTTKQCDSKCEYVVTKWRPCSECHTGVEVRTIFCLKVLNLGMPKMVAINNCDSDPTIGRPRPPAVKGCHGPGCLIPPRIRDPPTVIPPDFVPPKTNFSYLIGQRMLAIAGYPVSIDCTEIQAEVLADMIFGLPNGTTLAPGERLGKFVVQRHGPRNIVLIIDNVDSRDQGIYRCVAQISVDGVIIGIDSSYSSFSVYAPPVITYQHSITVAENHSVELACNVNGSPPPDVKWYVGHKEILTGGRFVIQINYSLLISNVQKSDEREYLCEAVNLLGQAQSFVSLRVEG